MISCTFSYGVRTISVYIAWCVCYNAGGVCPINVCVGPGRVREHRRG